MKQKVKVLPLVLIVLSFLALLWVNTGSNKEVGYTSCGGGGFISQSSLIPDNPGGPCLGSQVTESVSGRYENKIVLNEIIAFVAILGIITYILLRKNKAKTKH